MIEFRQGDIFEQIGAVQALVNPVNCVGVSGRGLALEFKRMWPASFKAYKRQCDDGTFRIGDIYVWHAPESERLSIIHLPTKKHWRDKSLVDEIELGLENLVDYVNRYASTFGIKRIAVPALGCGNGGLSWTTMKPVMQNILIEVKAHVLIYEPQEG